MYIIGFSAKAQHGKDTCADIFKDIAAEYDIQLAGWALADPLKATVFGEGGGTLSFEDVWITKPPHVRKRLQQRGTEEGRMVHGENVWVLQSEAYLRIIEQRMPFVDGIIFTDVRFPNEVDFIQAGGREITNLIQKEAQKRLAALGFAAYWDEDPEDSAEFLAYCAAEADVWGALQGITDIPNPGLALYIESNRPTLTGEAASHPSETVLDDLDKNTVFDGIITNNLDTTLDDLADQLRPYVVEMFNL